MQKSCDEGIAPQLDTPTEALTIIQQAITESGFQPGTDIFLALDFALLVNIIKLLRDMKFKLVYF